MYNNVTCIRNCMHFNKHAISWTNCSSVNIDETTVFFFSTEKQINLFLENNVKMYRGENFLEKISEKVYQNHS